MLRMEIFSFTYMVFSLHIGHVPLLTNVKGYPRARFIQALLEEGTPMTVTATIFDGYVLALSVFHHSMNYRSAILHGVSMPIDNDDADAKTHALKLVVDLTMPGRWENSRYVSEDRNHSGSYNWFVTESQTAQKWKELELLGWRSRLGGKNILCDIYNLFLTRALKC